MVVKKAEFRSDGGEGRWAWSLKLVCLVCSELEANACKSQVRILCSIMKSAFINASWAKVEGYVCGGCVGVCTTYIF